MAKWEYMCNSRSTHQGFAIVVGLIVTMVLVLHDLQTPMTC